MSLSSIIWKSKNLESAIDYQKKNSKCFFSLVNTTCLYSNAKTLTSLSGTIYKFDHDQTNSHRVINKRFGAEECWSYINDRCRVPGTWHWEFAPIFKLSKIYVNNLVVYMYVKYVAYLQSFSLLLIKKLDYPAHC